MSWISLNIYNRPKEMTKVKKYTILIFLLVISQLFSLYLNDVSGDGVTINWFTEEPSDSFLIVYDGSNESIYSEQEVTLHRFKVSGLQPGMSYAYTVKSEKDGKVIFRNGGILTTAPLKRTPFSFAVYGDSRSNHSVHLEIAHGIARENVPLVIHTGDLVSSDDTLDEWTSFFNVIDILSDSVFYSTIGNHEASAENYTKFFAFPGNKRYYSFWYGDVFFICLNTNEAFDKYSLQYIWLLTELEEAKEGDPAFIIVYFHHPPYSFGPHGDHLYIQQYLVPVFEDYKVDLVLNGHDHGYQRVEKNGVTYVISAGGGAPLYDIGSGKDLIASANAYHYMLFNYTVDGLFGYAKTAKGLILDSFYIQRRD
ncbi:MAG: Metallophosphoesterase [Mesotoga prima]|uniref:Metallophosphoesterase n=2 Tax=Mesotoga TaxID=1184396 RepID=A0A101HKR9_9BACT|nr:MAG: Metallophosphoesterase [Mesotoga prima]